MAFGDGGQIETMTVSITSIQNDLTDRLDQLETSLPSIPSKSLAFSRASARRVIDTTSDIACTVGRRVDSVWNTASTSAKTSAGQATSAANRTAKVARDTARQTAGQATSAVNRTAKVASSTARQTAGQVRAETAQTIDAATDATEQLFDEGAQAVDPDRPNPGVPYAQWTKAQLYDRAQDLDIEGRSAMTKKELVAALRS